VDDGGGTGVVFGRGLLQHGPSEWVDLARNLWIGLNIVGRFGLKLVDWVEHSEPVWSKTCWIRLMGCVEPA
jgi:hypothetical protein